MPNIIIDLENEIWRVRRLLPFFAGRKRAEVQGLLLYAETSKASGQVGYMKEALAELLEIDEPGAPRI